MIVATNSIPSKKNIVILAKDVIVLSSNSMLASYLEFYFRRVYQDLKKEYQENKTLLIEHLKTWLRLNDFDEDIGELEVIKL